VLGVPELDAPGDPALGTPEGGVPEQATKARLMVAASARPVSGFVIWDMRMFLLGFIWALKL
jgi:hypothetical protein